MGGGGWEAGGGLHRPIGLFGVAMSPRSVVIGPDITGGPWTVWSSYESKKC